MDEWLIALYVDNDIPLSANFPYCLVDAVGATAMVARCHDHIAVKSLHFFIDALVIGCHINMVDDLPYLFVNSLDDGLVAKESQWFARETCGGKPCWYDANKLIHVNNLYLEDLNPSIKTYFFFIMRW
jgi:hypothetical protein